MKPVPNKRTTPYDVGDQVVYRYSHYQGGSAIRFQIVELVKCQTFTACAGCSTGNIAYRTKRFKKRLGRKNFVLCPVKSGQEEYVRWTPPLMNDEVIDGY